MPLIFTCLRYRSIFFLSRSFSTSSPKSNNVLKSLFSHFQYGRKAKEAARERGIDLKNLTAEQRIKLQPVLQLKSAFRVVNVVMGLMAVIATFVWYTRRQRQTHLGKEIIEEFQPIWMDLKYFKHKAALINEYLLPEQIVGKLNAIKHFQFTKDDCICASFPKSGTTLIQEIVYLIESNFDYSSATKKDISERYAFLEWPTVVYVCRNPKDVTVSLFHFLRSINIELTYSGPWNQFARSFLIDEVYYAPWWRHVNDYQALNDRICFVTYEDLLTAFRGTVRRIASYLGKEKELTEEQLNKLENWCSFDSMKKNPRVNYNWFREWGFVNKSFSFLRKGEIGDWLNHFDVDQSKEYDQMVSTRLSPTIPSFNYGISSEDQQRLYEYDGQQHR